MLRLPLLAFVILALVAGPADALRQSSDPEDPFRRIRIEWDLADRHRDALRDVAMEIVGREDGAWIDFVARDAELERLRERGIPFRITIEDLEADNALRFGAGGGFGVYHTYSETVQVLDDLHANYPSITTDKIQIGTTWEGRAIWAMKISDNPLVEEAGEPEVLFDGIHHAREIMTVEVVLDYMTWLCEEYGVDEEATQLVDTRQIWFVPIVNPDGFVYNETTNPGGGGLWRKNRRDDLGGCIGVDLNRNYPYEWGLLSGSSNNPCDDTYHGPAAASEAETQAMMDLINAHEFVTHNSYHSVVAVILHPWGYTNSPVPEIATFEAIGTEMARDSGYGVGTVQDLLGYLASGGMFDWAYGEQATKPKIYAFTTEIGGSGWWPAPSERDGLLAENHYSNVYLTRVAGVTLGLESYAVTGGDGNGRLDPGETANLLVTLRNAGVLANATGVTLTLSSDDSYLAFSDVTADYGAMNAQSSATNGLDALVVTAAAATPVGHIATIEALIEDDAGFSTVETISVTIGSAPVLYFTDFEADEGGWTQDASHTASTGAFVRIDPNATAYQPGDDTTPSPGVHAWVTGQNSSVGADDVDGGISATRSPSLDLSGVAAARLSLNWFHGQRDPGDDPTGDFFRIDLSNDDGATYPASLVSLGDASSGPAWQMLTVDVHTLLPLTNAMRVRVQASDGPATGDIIEGGIDDVFVLDLGSANQAPAAPALVSPPDGATGQPASPALVVSNAVDPEGDALTYTYRVYSDALLTQEVTSVTGVSEGGGGTTSWTVMPPLADGLYWWRAHASDVESQGPYMAAASFEVQNDPTDVRPAGPAEGPLLAAPRPNPFVADTRIAFTLPTRSRVRIDIFDVNGRHVRRLRAGIEDAGAHVISWDGRDAGGHASGAGVYFVQLHVNGQRQTRKMVRIP